MSSIQTKPKVTCAKPFLKWAGGKTQLLNELLAKAPRKFDRYVEPFLGGGSMFFALRPREAVLSDSNLELINTYRCIVHELDAVLTHLSQFENSKEYFYKIRERRFEELEPAFAAARTIYLNRTCYNGLYRVNKQGHFNVPYGKYKNPDLYPYEVLETASVALQHAQILHSDYKEILTHTTKPGDFVYLDPPYLPVSKYADFKRYTKEQFYEEDHRELAELTSQLQSKGCYVLLTNSNHPLVHELYAPHEIEIVSTRRNISSKSTTRNSEDAIVTIKPRQRLSLRAVPKPMNAQMKQYPPTRYMGAKNKVLPHIHEVAQQFSFDSVLDLFSGSGVVSYMFKTMGKKVIANDYMTMNATIADAMIANNHIQLTEQDTDDLFAPNPNVNTFVQDTFAGLYFADADNAVIDLVRSNIVKLRNGTKRAIAMSALLRACIKKRARGIFTFTGLRYDDGRVDLRLSMEEHIRNAVKLINNAVFDNGEKNVARHGDAMSTRYKADLVYLDPPYYSPLSDNEYVRRYHFLEGLAKGWKGVDIQWHTKTKKFKSYPTPFSSRSGAEDAFDKLLGRLRDSIVLVSYSSNSLPTKETIISIVAKYKHHVEVMQIDHKYCFANHKESNQNSVHEYLFVGW
ncbi:MAG: Dam family site-specific DNA-(adenine-N6)-methyltransferase [Gammaproteobacteria bacterium]|nr:Dam family site-specific DNA-(adenine-N6)-methyltransferase [Gammaproteobacteria bacterium]MYF01823.1 Dam family site-specific DNA-(adenine-N6)-methyltransferase [Gammaproteobacteria bacterium]MYI76580.1 Dam family site-specific DNA-(adenine-N6)-methyltransferase [Gammaproteobacteria bacterium]